VFYGIVYALLENDMRRILAYSIVNQVGFMVAGIGIGTEMALNGAAAHAFTHIIYKALLLMSAGSVLLMTGKRKCSELGGLFHSMPLTTLCGTIGALAISSFPLTSGFISKSMVSQAAADGQMLAVWLLLTAASAGVFLHAGIKFPWFVFFQKDSGLRPAEPPAPMRWAMLAFAFLCIALGVWAEPLYALLPYAVTYQPYTAAHVLTQLQLLLFSGLAFFVMLPYLKRTLTITLDTDWVWRRLLPALAQPLERAAGEASKASGRAFDRSAQRTLDALERHTREDSALARTQATRNMALVVLLMLLAYLMLYLAG
jgi:multicomponent Na+:H+ antiporter subunit D